MPYRAMWATGRVSCRSLGLRKLGRFGDTVIPILRLHSCPRLCYCSCTAHNSRFCGTTRTPWWLRCLSVVAHLCQVHPPDAVQPEPGRRLVGAAPRVHRLTARPGHGRGLQPAAGALRVLPGAAGWVDGLRDARG